MEKCTRRDVGEKRFFEKKVLLPWRAHAVEATDGGEVYFSAASRKVPKESPQRGRTYGSPPLDSPTPVMRDGDGITLTEVCIRRKDAFREAHCVRVHTRRNMHWNRFLGRLTIDAPPRRPPVRPGGSVCGTNGCWNEVFGERFTAGMKFSESASPLG